MSDIEKGKWYKSIDENGNVLNFKIGASPVVVKSKMIDLDKTYGKKKADEMRKAIMSNANVLFGKTDDPAQVEKFKKMFEDYDKSPGGGNS